MTYTYTPDGQVYSAKETGTNRTVDYVYSFDAKHRLISSEKKVNGTTVLRTRQLFNSNDQLTHENWKMDTKTYYRILTYNTGMGNCLPVEFHVPILMQAMLRCFNGYLYER